MASLWLRLLGLSVNVRPESGLRRRWKKKKVSYEKMQHLICAFVAIQRRWKREKDKQDNLSNMA